MADQTEKRGTQVLHVRDSSKEDMDRLFQAAMDPNAKANPGNVPFRMRNLPASFFTPPEIKKNHHSREGSTDSTGYTNTPPGHLRAHSSPAQLQQTPLSTVPPPPHHVRQHSCELVDEQPLPPGWEMAKTPQGQRYFLNHLSQQTTWVDPRKANFNQSHTVPMGSSSHQSSQTSQHSPNVSMQNLQSVQNIPLPGGWEQAQTPEGEIYYINHIDRTTTWFDPRLPMNMQLLQMNQQQQSQGISAPQVQGQGPAVTLQVGPRGPPGHQQQQQTALQKLQKEKELLRQRQEELNRQELALRNPAVSNHPLPNQIRADGQNMDISSQMTTETDPCLGQSNSNDLHARQESADSGLGGMGTGTNFLSRTPEEFLGNMNELDTQDGSHRQGDFSSMDMGGMGDAEHSNMDSDDLVPSLQEDDISNDLLNDVETVLSSNKMENMDSLLTWL